MTKQEKTKTDKKNIKNSKVDALKAVAWLVEASFRTYVGVIVLQHFTGYLATAVSIYALATAGIIVATHFAKAHK